MKLLAVMASLYLALAPAMDVGALLHAIELCHAGTQAGSTAHADCHDANAHQHPTEPEPDQPQPTDLPGDCCMVVEHNVAPCVFLAAVTHAAPPELMLLRAEPAAYQPPCAPMHQRVRPPPNDAPVGIVILLV